MTNLVGKLIEKSEEIYNDIDYETDKHANAKAACVGVFQGCIDGAVLMYIPLLIGCCYWRHKAQKK